MTFSLLQYLVEEEGFELVLDDPKVAIGKQPELNLIFRDLKRGCFQWAWLHDFDRWANSVEEETMEPKTANGATKLVNRLTILAHLAKNKA